MNQELKSTLIGAAIAGILGASTVSFALTARAAGDAEMMGHCIGANSCSGKGNCAQAGKNDCAGKNGCEGKGFLEMTKAQCDAMAAKGKKVTFEPKKGDMKEKKS